jgi:hypothetical protein
MTIRIKTVAPKALAIIALTGAMSTAASAAIINFDQNNAQLPRGTISYNGSGGPVFGSGIQFDGISLADATAPDGHQNSLFCQGCTLNFATGLNTSEGPSVWTFNSLGSSFTLTGDAFEEDAQGNPTGSPIAQGGLLTGFFTGTQTAIKSSSSSLPILFFDGSGVDQKSTSLLRYFGLNGHSQSAFANTEFSLGTATFGNDGSFSSTVTAADLNNAVTPVPVPEPSELGLFGLGVLFMGILGFRRRKGGV